MAGLVLLLLLNACSHARLADIQSEPRLTGGAFVTSDGRRLPMHIWLPEDDPSAVIVALHGFNDYGRFIDRPARFFQTGGIAVYAYDQRGFGGSSTRGRWAGVEAYVQDLIDFTRLIQRRHARLPVYVLGESMGGAVAIVAARHGLTSLVDGLILAAPAVWARWTMPWYQRTLLWLGDHLLPWVKLSGEGLGILPSDNLAMLRALSRNPLVIKETRIDAIAGLADLMDQAMTAGPELRIPTLYLYGNRDQIIPPDPTRQFLRLADPTIVRVAWYDGGYHMLLRDLEAKRYWRDILAWISAPNAPLPSGADRREERLAAGKQSDRSQAETIQSN